MENEKQYFLQLTEPQIEALKLCVDLKLDSLRGTEDEVLKKFAWDLRQASYYLANAPTHITGLRGFPSRTIGIMRIVE